MNLLQALMKARMSLPSDELLPREIAFGGPERHRAFIQAVLDDLHITESALLEANHLAGRSLRDSVLEPTILGIKLRVDPNMHERAIEVRTASGHVLARYVANDDGSLISLKLPELRLKIEGL